MEAQPLHSRGQNTNTTHTNNHATTAAGMPILNDLPVNDRLCVARMQALKWEIRATMLLLAINIITNVIQVVR